jgi:putative spermidine/putrescine transport system substrate-binding protein
MNTSKKTWAVSCLLVAGACMSTAQARDFTWASWGGALQNTQKQVYMSAFADTYKKPIAEDVYLGKWAKFEAMSQSGNVDWDLVNVESAEAQRGCEEGVFQKLDYARFGHQKSDFIDGAAQECGVGAYVWSFVVAYNADSIKTPPQSTAAFWDLKTYPGRRAMRKGPRFNMELALLGDGVKAGDVYKVLSTKEGQQRAFKKLDTIKSQIVWWDAPAQVPAMVASGTVAMAIAPHARIADAKNSGKNLGMVFTPGLVGVDYWVIPTGSPFAQQSYDALKTLTTPALQAKFAGSFPYAPTVKSADTLLDPKLSSVLPVGKNLTGSVQTSTAESNRFWSDNGDALTEQWNTWLAH